MGQTYKMTPLVLPEDANNQGVDFYSSKPLVANINTSGLITALSEGNTQIKVVTKEGSFEKVVTVTVIPKLEENAITFSKPIQVNGNQLTGIEERTTVKSLLSKITTKYRVEIINKSGKILTDDDLIGTNSKVRMYDNEQLIIEYGIILYGDLNGDGKINSIDLLVLQRHILELKRLEGLFLKAGNIGQNGKAPSSVDLLKIQRHILNLKKIEQSINTIINEKVINQKETATIKLTSNKQNVEANEEFTVSVNTENINVGACAIKFYYDQSKLELTTKNENINVGNNSAIYTWFDEEGAKNIDENKSIASLNFKAKEDGINLISFEGEFYNEKEEKILPNVETLEVKVGGKEQQEPIIEESTDEANSNLAVLRLDKEGINPLFENNIKEYYIIVNENVDNIDVTAIPENKNASVKITGNKNLKNGMNTILVKVTSQNKKNVSEYKIYVTKTNDVESANANLETLAIENVLLSPEFNKNITNYKGEVNNDVATLNILAIPESQNANVKIAGGDNLKEGNNNITITVYAPNNITFRKYQINIYKKSIKEQEKQMQISNNNDNYNYNVDSALTIDNSKQVQEMRDETMQRKAENYLWIIIIALAIIVGSGITVIIIYRKNKNRI